MPESVEISPSILAADFARLSEALRQAEKGGAGAIHVDVMDGHFVPNLTIGPPVIACLRPATALPLDCHLMIAEAERWIGDYLKAGAARITVHVEACPHLHRTIHSIRAGGAEAGVALNPATPLGVLEEVLPDLDQVLIMSVNPGFAGQKFIEASLGKMNRLAEMIAARGLKTRIQVDGGVGMDNAAALARAGARRLVAGAAAFRAPDPARAIADLKQEAEKGLTR